MSLLFNLQKIDCVLYRHAMRIGMGESYETLLPCLLYSNCIL